VPRIRTIKPDLWADEKLASLPRDARLLFLALISNADDAGRMRGNVLFVRAQCFPYDADLDVDKLLDLLSEAGFITRYEADGQSFLFIKSFCKHQKIDKPRDSVLPAPDVSPKRRRRLADESPTPPRSIAEESTTDKDKEGNGSGEGSGSGNGLETVSPPTASRPPTAALWEAYSEAYEKRYGAEPVRNATVNGQLLAVIKRLGAEEAPDVAAFYVAHKAAFYAQKGHPVGLLLLDAEKLRTEWITGRQITSTAARQQERTAANGQVWDSLLKGEKHGVG
jgi:hypothetical protein